MVSISNHSQIIPGTGIENNPAGIQAEIRIVRKALRPGDPEIRRLYKFRGKTPQLRRTGKKNPGDIAVIQFDFSLAAPYNLKQKGRGLIGLNRGERPDLEVEYDKAFAFQLPLPQTRKENPLDAGMHSSANVAFAILLVLAGSEMPGSGLNIGGAFP